MFFFNLSIISSSFQIPICLFHIIHSIIPFHKNVQSKKSMQDFLYFLWHTSYCSISLFVFSQTNVPQGCPVRRFLTGRRVDWASGRLRSIFYSTTYLTFDSLRPSYFSCANSLSRNSDTSSMSSLSIKSSFINTSRSV